jgi:uncharacterized protein (DUF58 family)
MVPAHVIKKIKRIHIKSSRRVNSIMAGQYKSVFRGSGIEFEEVRGYSPGDDIKSIDWKVSARLGKPFIKLYREERESIVMLLIDMSGSQKFGTFYGEKLEKAAEVASILAFNAIKNNDKIGVVFFTDTVEKYIPPQKGSGYIWRVIKEIFTFVPKGRGTDISAALDFLSKISKKRTFTFIMSDFLDKDFLKSLQILRRKHEIIGIQFNDEGDYHLPEKGIVTLSDLETGHKILFDASDKKTRRYFNENRKKEIQRTQELFSKVKSDVIELQTSASVFETLSAYFRYRERHNR